MNTKIKSLAVVIALCGLASAAQAAPVGQETDPYWGQFVNQDQPVLTVVDATAGGIQEDVYWSQYVPQEQTIIVVIAYVPPADTLDPYWSQFMPPESQVLAAVPKAPDGQEDDPYWSQFVPQEQERVAVAVSAPPVVVYGPYWNQFVPVIEQPLVVAINPESLPAGTWRLAHYDVIDADGTHRHPLGEKFAGYMLITPQRYAAVTITPDPMSSDGVIHYVGTLNYDSNKSIHPVASLNPKMVGVDQVKSWQLVNEQLTFITPTDAATGSFSRLFWELVK